ncbi:c-type cytochrome [Vulgatibacter sp.]|uniref:c-type cytochrome n=1 Tax=Vulgatibacter sp. TaxID=1971226 RepID=UPI003565D0AF
MRRLFLTLGLSLVVSACGSEAETTPAAEHGAALAASPSLSGSSFNTLACTSCHAVAPGDERILAGYPLAGAAARPSWWGGKILDLREAVDFCLVYFMKGDPLDPASEEGRALYDYLLSIDRDGPTEALPLTVVQRIEEAPPRGDAARGAEVHRLACGGCHGEPSTGAGRLVAAAPILPDQAREEALEAFPEFEPALVFTEKVRHGQFFGVGGNMPLYSLEALSDEDLGALLSFYGL